MDGCLPCDGFVVDHDQLDFMPGDAPPIDDIVYRYRTVKGYPDRQVTRGIDLLSQRPEQMDLDLRFHIASFQAKLNDHPAPFAGSPLRYDRHLREEM